MFQNLNILKVIVLGIIITLVTGTIVFSYIGAQDAAADKRNLADVDKIHEALKLFYEVNGFYPQDAQGLPKGIEAYLSFYPKPSSTNGLCQPSDTYYYERRASGGDFKLTFCLPKTGVHSLTSRGYQ
jgi:hypothetical protein